LLHGRQIRANLPVHDFRWHAADIASILDALYLQLADQVFYGGVNAGSAQFQPIPCLFDQYQSMMHGVLCLLLPATPIRSSTMATRP
jgi:hypothetical protein